MVGGCWWLTKVDFTRSDELARHRRSHSGIKTYKCQVCSFSSWSAFSSELFVLFDHNIINIMKIVFLNGLINLMVRCVPRGLPVPTTLTSTSRSTVETELLAQWSTPSRGDLQQTIITFPVSSSKASPDKYLPVVVIINQSCSSTLHPFTNALNYCNIRLCSVASHQNKKCQ